MKFNLIRTAFFAIILMMFSVSCSKYQKLLKSSDYELKYKKALEYYDEKDYARAMTLFEQTRALYKGSKEGEEIYYRYAYCHYYIKDYVLAAYYFQNFSTTYGNSERNEECMYMAAYCYYLDSPIPILDQTNTRKAINELQLFMSRYPNSKRVTKCNELMDELRDKLAEKSFRNAKLYYELSNFKAAVVSLKNCIEDYPNGAHKEEAAFLILKSRFSYAQKSIEKKQKERYEETIKEYKIFKRKYSDSEFMKEAERIFKVSTKKQEKLS